MAAVIENEKSDIARLWQLALTQRLLVIFSCILSILSVICTFLPFIAIYLIIEELLKHVSQQLPWVSSQMIFYGWLACGAAVLAVVLNFAALACSHLAAFRALYQLKLDFVKHLSLLPLGFHHNHSTGELRKIVDDNIEKLELFIAHQLPDIVGTFATPIVLLVILFFFDWRLGLATLLPIILAYLVLIQGYGQKGAKDHFQNYQKQQETMNNISVEYVRGISVIKAFNQTFFSFRKFHSAVKAYTDFCLEITQRFETTMGLFLLILNNVYLFILPVAIGLYDPGASYFDFALATIFYLVFSVSIAGPFLKLMYVSNQMQLVVSSIEHIDAVLKAKPLPIVTHPQQSKSYDIRFNGVTFAYQQREADSIAALNDVTFVAPAGKITALVGPSGSGKSTIAHLIPRFFDINAGTIEIGGTDIRAMSPDYLQSLVSFVFQDVFLFKQSILDNLRIGNPNASREAIIAAAKATQCHDFIQNLPQGYDTVIGSHGVHLSGGERQRLIFARAIVKDAPILVLDEATSFADPENEHKIQQAMTALMAGRTTIIIAHRLSSVVQADKIMVLDKGNIVESGGHQALLSQQGKYYQMWQWYTRTLQWQIAADLPEV